MLSPDILKAIEICLELNIPFVAYSLPGKKEIEFFANPSSTGENKAKLDGRHEFIINYFNNEYPYIIGIQHEVTELDIIANAEKYQRNKEPEIFPWPYSTDCLQYHGQIHELIDHLKSRGGKTVLSRVITGELAIDWLDNLEWLFSHRDLFCNIYFTQETGCWIGSTPELLLDLNHKTGQLSTMSLAGTRIASFSNADWDNKNIEEHNYVTKYIIDTLSKYDIKANVSAPSSVSFGNIEHLCHKITANIGDNDIIQILNDLSPTPAVAGYPKDQAIIDISQIEIHPRYCYAGYIGVSDNVGLHVYVNLRCAHIDHSKICIYGGGGITSKSNAKDEWLETEMKTRHMSYFIRQV